MIIKRSYTIEMTVVENPTKILLNGAGLKDWKYYNPGKVTINLAAENLNKKQKIVMS